MMGRNNGRNSGRSSERGFAAMSAEDQRAIARKGGEAVSENRQHMAEIGRKGGKASAQVRGAQANRRGQDASRG